MQYCSHLWAGAPAYQTDPLDSIQRRVIRIVDDPILTGGLESLSLRRDFASLCVFYRLYNGECSEELFDLVPTAHFYNRTARQRRDVNPHFLELPRSTTQRFSRTFIPRTTMIWRELPAAVFPLRYDMEFFKKGVIKFLRGRLRVSDSLGVANVYRRR